MRNTISKPYAIAADYVAIAADGRTLRGRVEALARKYPLYPDLEDWKML